MVSNNESKATVESTSNQPKVVLSKKERNSANEKTSIPPNRTRKSKKNRSQKKNLKRKQSRKMRKSAAQKTESEKTSNDGEENMIFWVVGGCGIIAIILVIVYYIFYL